MKFAFNSPLSTTVPQRNLLVLQWQLYKNAFNCAEDDIQLLLVKTVAKHGHTCKNTTISSISSLAQHKTFLNLSYFFCDFLLFLFLLPIFLHKFYNYIILQLFLRFSLFNTFYLTIIVCTYSVVICFEALFWKLPCCDAAVFASFC